MTDEEIIAVVTAHKEGKKIECFKNGSLIATFDNTGHEPAWNFEKFNYRIKPEPHYRPFESAEEVMEAIKEHESWLKSKASGRYIQICEFDDELTWLYYFNTGTPFEDMYERYTFLDGTPFGKLEEE